MLLSLIVRFHTALLARAHRPADDERGQTTAEYALVLLGAAAIALLLTMWARETGKLGRLLDAVVDNLIDMVK